MKLQANLSRGLYIASPGSELIKTLIPTSIGLTFPHFKFQVRSLLKSLNQSVQVLLNLVFLIRTVSLRLLVNIGIPTQDSSSMFGAMKDLSQTEAFWG